MWSYISTSLGNLGLMICYDLRFPELSLELRKRGADILTFPSAFTTKTGQAHWGKFTFIFIRLIFNNYICDFFNYVWWNFLEVLLRARAIENQCYVIARYLFHELTYDHNHNYNYNVLICFSILSVSAQIGKHNEKRISYGHSMANIIDIFF